VGGWLRTGCWLRASGVQRVACAGVLLYISRSIMERLSSGGGVTGPSGAGEEGGGEGGKSEGLCVVGVGGCGVVVSGGVVASSNGRSVSVSLSIKERVIGGVGLTGGGGTEGRVCERGCACGGWSWVGVGCCVVVGGGFGAGEDG